MPSANIKPPINKNIIELAYGAAASETEKTLKRGKSTIGRRAVANMGIASVIHQMSIQAATADTFQARSDISSSDESI
jgi:hypothetical protein